MATIAITDRYMRINGIPASIPMDYWTSVIKKTKACGFGMASTTDGYFLEMGFPDKKHVENAVSEILSACELVSVDVSNKDNIPNSDSPYPEIGEFRGLSEASQRAAVETLKYILLEEYRCIDSKSEYGHLVREMFMQLEGCRLHPAGIYNGEERTPL